MNTYSKAFAKVYDSLMGDYSGIIHTTQKLVYEYTEKKKKVDLLELGCGTGNILKTFPQSSFTLYGLDIAPEMLEIAKKKVKRAKFLEADMSNFHIFKKFDVVICVFDSINHLLEFKKWENTFRLVAQHLKKDGIFIFDMNTVKRHQALTALPAYVKKEKNRLICIKVLTAGENIYNARFEIFSNISKIKIKLTEENVFESSFPLEGVKKELRQYFTIEKIVDPYRELPTEESGRLFFVCKKMVRG